MLRVESEITPPDRWVCSSDMTIGTSILLIAAGAIMKYAVTAHVSGIDIQTVGVILMLVGILGLILSLLYTFVWSDRARARGAGDIDPPTRNLPPRDRF
jgi:heme/copper-type cytochrome/quinol oxidase subunit 2